LRPLQGAINRALVVNADDFGQSAGVTRGIIEAHERGIVTSASLMVLWPASAEAAAYSRRQPGLSVGLHLDLGEWTCRAGVWEALYTRVDSTDPDAVDLEVRKQLERYRDLVGQNPTHLDSHQHVHRSDPVRSTLMRVAGELRVPLRHLTPSIQHCGSFYGQTATGEPLPDLIGMPALAALLRRLPEGVTELACHPGYAHDLESMYTDERTIELHSLCAPEVRQVLADAEIRLISFADLQAA
jgi:chitin disaccharide deacetylase